MPYSRRRYRKKRKKHPLYRGRRRRNKRNRMSYNRVRQVSGMPDRLNVMLKYSDTTTHNTAFSASQTWALNGLYDPDITGTGTQPNGFDQFMAFYERYEVRASKIIYWLSNNGTVQCQAVLYPSHDSVAVGVNTGSEQPYAKRIMLAGKDSQPSKVFTNYITVKKLEGRAIDSVNFTGTSSSNPTSLKYWQFAIISNDAISNLDVFTKQTIIYYCSFFRRKSLSTS